MSKGRQADKTDGQDRQAGPKKPGSVTYMTCLLASLPYSQHPLYLHLVHELMGHQRLKKNSIFLEMKQF